MWMKWWPLWTSWVIYLTVLMDNPSVWGPRCTPAYLVHGRTCGRSPWWAVIMIRQFRNENTHYQSLAESTELVGKIDKWNCWHNACERGQFPVVCVSVCRTTPPNCFDQSSSNFQGMLWGILVMHISKIRLICWEINYFPYMPIFTKMHLSHSTACKSNIRKRWQ